MTPQEKAQDMYDKMLNSDIMNMTKYCAKQCALIAVEEIYFGIFHYLKNTDELQNADREFAYWEQVKQEINLL